MIISWPLDGKMSEHGSRDKRKPGFTIILKQTCRIPREPDIKYPTGSLASTIMRSKAPPDRTTSSRMGIPSPRVGAPISSNNMGTWGPDRRGNDRDFDGGVCGTRLKAGGSEDGKGGSNGGLAWHKAVYWEWNSEGTGA